MTAVTITRADDHSRKQRLDADDIRATTVYTERRYPADLTGRTVTQLLLADGRNVVAIGDIASAVETAAGGTWGDAVAAHRLGNEILGGAGAPVRVIDEATRTGVPGSARGLDRLAMSGESWSIDVEAAQ